MKKFFSWIKKHERHLSAGAMVAGFIFDNFFFERIDLASTHIIFLANLFLASLAILLGHALEVPGRTSRLLARIRSLAPIAGQFAVGGLLSGFLIFYARSASLGQSWLFLLLLALAFIGNEALKKYHERLTFSSILLFFTFFSYAVFALPVFLGTMGSWVFVSSGVLAAVAFALFLGLLALVNRTSFSRSSRHILFGAATLLVALNVLYFTKALPPVPLALKEAGIYHTVVKTPSGYRLTAEKNSGGFRIFSTETVHVASREALYAYSAVFAPIDFGATIIHEWQSQDAAGEWVTRARITFPVSGGRDGGYRGYSMKSNLTPGAWRVNIETERGEIIGRIRFDVVSVTTRPPLKTIDR